MREKPLLKLLCIHLFIYHTAVAYSDTLTNDLGKYHYLKIKLYKKIIILLKLKLIAYKLSKKCFQSISPGMYCIFFNTKKHAFQNLILHFLN